MKNKSHRYDKNRPRSMHGRKYTKNKMCPSIMMVICIQQHLSNIWSSIHKKSQTTLKLRWKKPLLIEENSVSNIFLHPINQQILFK